MELKQSIKDKLKRPLRDLRISVTDRCNFRCPYCMPAEIYGERFQFLPQTQVLTFEEITRLTTIFVKLGVTKVRLTGGEPTVRVGLEKLVGMLSKVPGAEDIAMTTNGYLLEQKAKALKDAGLQRVTVSVDTLDDATFAKLNGKGYGKDRIMRGGPDPAEQRGTEQKSREQLPDHRRLTDPLHDLAEPAADGDQQDDLEDQDRFGGFRGPFACRLGYRSCQ